ncbi:hypothetical protein E5676_scaffold475G00880 [Cucumis melo var. makuwa]|uniref:Uncharacterized protein n=1 Tax=Cucumis melo var. makuwa TaxID=1194695 RepID=A0A5A7STK9_CUCMM|nr:hypothetical protein E6C27_scaffold65G005590 [Cucumis melo var. makuwa]TYK09098.1 hypothetical protein E5676_scaffold475G00880 [Cucumis melo var. makuwa]
MAAVVVGIGVRKQRIFPHASSLASIESLSLPLVSAFSSVSLAFVPKLSSCCCCNLMADGC